MPGMIVCIGRLPPAMRLGWSGSMTKLAPRFCSITPEDVQRPEPKAAKSELMKEIALPSPSTTVR